MPEGLLHDIRSEAADRCVLPVGRGFRGIHLGDEVFFHGKISISFAMRFSERPSLTIGDNTGFGHEVMLAVGKRIKIGSNCLISSRTMIVDSGGHPVDTLLASRACHPCPKRCGR